MSGSRISRRQLQPLSERLTGRDRQVLEGIEQHRFLTTRQVTGFCFTDKATPTAALRATNRLLLKLTELGLVVPLGRRIGGVRGGSGGYVWNLTEKGTRLLNYLNSGADQGRRRHRPIEPTSTFLQHTLAVAETHLRLEQIARSGQIAITRIDLEPACWRTYLAPGGATLRLKPDLAAITQTGQYDDHWFLEIDLDTEPPSRIVRKCLQYQEYQHTGIEQHQTGIFPAVIWIVPDTARREQLSTRLAQEGNINSRLFTVITLDQLEQLITEGRETFTNQTDGQKGGEPS